MTKITYIMQNSGGNSMLTIKISSFSNEAASEIKGIELKNIIEPLLNSSSEFSIDFDGIFMYASPFFNNSFAKLALIYGFDKIKSIPLFNLSDIGKLAYDTSLENALLLSENPDFMDKINDIINSNTPKKDV